MQERTWLKKMFSILSLNNSHKFMRTHKKDILCLIVIFSVASLFLFYQIPEDFGDDCITSGTIAMLINKAHESNTPISKLFENLASSSENRLMTPYEYEKMCFATPLWHLLLSVTYLFFGVSVFSTLVLSSVIGLLAVILVYFLGKEMYGRMAGFLSAILLSSSLLFIFHIRSGSGFITLIPLTVLSAIYFFYVAHKRMNRRFLWISGIAMSITFFDGYSPVFLLIPILLVFIIWNINFRSLTRKRTNLYAETKHPSIKDYLLTLKKNLFCNLFGIKDYLLTVVIIVGTFFLLTVGYDLYLRAPTFTTFSHIYTMRVQQQSLLALPSSFDLTIVLTSNIKKFFEDMFIAINSVDSLYGVHTQHFLPGAPYIFPFVSTFFFVGLVLSIKRRAVADKMCLIWWLIPLFTFTILSGAIGRAVIVMVPVIYIIAAKAMVDITQLFKGSLSFSHISKKWIVVLLLFLGVLLTSYVSYQDVFHTYYGQQNGRIPRYYGMSEVYGYIMANSKPGGSQIVLGDPILLPYDAFVFYTKGQYPVLYWQESIGPLKYKLIRNMLSLDEWEKNVLYNKSDIFYVFGLGGRYCEMPGQNLFLGMDESVSWLGAASIIQPDNSDGLAWFRELHPTLQPVKIVYFNNGAPAFAIYQVNNTTPRNHFFSLEVGSNELYSYTQSDVDLLTIKGPVNNLTISTDNNSSFHFSINVVPSQTISITYDKNSEIVFEPLIESDDYVQDVFEEKNMHFNSSQGLKWIELDGDSGYVTYKIESPFGNIERVTLQTNPRLFNDKDKKNSIECLYSVDNNKYIPIYEVKSNGNGEWASYIYPYTFYSSTPTPFQKGEWAGVFERQTYHEIYPDSNVVYIKFLLTGEKKSCQLWSLEGLHRMFFKAQIDTSSAPKLRLEQGLNRLELHMDTDSGKVSLATGESTYRPEIFEAEKLYPSSAWSFRLYNNATQAGTIDRWINFDGSDDYVEVPDDTDLDGITALSIEMWFRAERATDDMIYRKGSDPVYFSYITGPTHEGTFSIYSDLQNASAGVVTSTSGWHFKQWHHFVLTYDGTTTKIYRDGVEVYSGTTITGALKNNTDALLLGMAPDSSQPFQGQIKEVCFYNRALSAAEVQGGYSNYTGLVLHFNMTSWNPDAGTWNDLSGYSNDGTIYGATAEEGLLPEARLLVYSPNVTLEEGVYEAVFRLKVADNSLDVPVVKVDVVAGDKVLDELTLKGTEFAESNAYQDFTIHFNTNGTENLSFRVHDFAATVLGSDYIDICVFKGFLITGGPGIRGRDPAPEGLLDYGPGTSLGEPGVYEASFRLKVADNSLDVPVVKVDVVSGDKVLGNLSVKGTDFLGSDAYQVFTIYFNATGTENLHCRVLTYANTSLWIDYIGVSQLPIKTFELVGENVADETARSNQARYASETCPQGYLAYVSSPLGEPGIYQAVFRLKVADNSLDVPVVKVDVVSGDKVLGELVLKGTDFAKSNAYQDFTIPFNTDGTENLAFRVHYLGVSALWADYMDIRPSEGIIFESEDSFSHIGTNEADAGAHNGFARYGSKSNPPGLLVFGPGTPLGEGGAYQANFRLKVADNSLDVSVVKVDVVAGDKVLDELVLKGTDFAESNAYQDFTIYFDTTGTENLQYRVLTYAKTDLWIDYIEVISPIKTFDSEDTPLFVGQNVADTTARSDQARYASYDQRGLLLYSPNVTLEEGAFQAVFRLKVADNSLGVSVVKIDVVAGDKVLNELTLKGTDFLRSDVYQTFTINFDADGTEGLVFRVHYLGVSALWADYISIYESIQLRV